MLGWMNPMLESWLLGEISIISDMQMTPPQWQKANRNWSSFLIKVKKEIEKANLKLNIQKMKIAASSHITSWQIDGEKVQTVTDFLFLCSKITVDDDCSHEIKRCLLLGRKVMTNLDSVLKIRDITLLTKVCTVKTIYCHPAYLLYMQSASCKMLGWTKQKLESRLLGEISLISVMQISPPNGRKRRGIKEPLDERGEWKS